MQMTSTELNEAAVKIIMLAGDGRDAANKAIKASLADAPYSEVDALLKEAKVKVTQAHRIQTDIIQETLETEGMQSTLIFSHAQDTLMTVHSEINILGHMVEMYRKLTSGS